MTLLYKYSDTVTTLVKNMQMSWFSFVCFQVTTSLHFTVRINLIAPQTAPLASCWSPYQTVLCTDATLSQASVISLRVVAPESFHLIQTSFFWTGPVQRNVSLKFGCLWYYVERNSGSFSQMNDFKIRETTLFFSPETMTLLFQTIFELFPP